MDETTEPSGLSAVLNAKQDRRCTALTRYGFRCRRTHPDDDMMCPIHRRMRLLGEL